VDRREFMRLLVGGTFATTVAASGMLGCSVKRTLAETVVLEDKTKAPDDDTATALDGEPAQSLALVSVTGCKTGLEQLIKSYGALHPNISFDTVDFVETDEIAGLAGAGGYDCLVTDMSAPIQQLIAAGLVDGSLVVSPFSTRLNVVASPDAAMSMRSVSDLEDGSVEKILIGDSALMFSGAFANQALYAKELYSSQSGTDGAYGDSIAGKIQLVSSLDEMESQLADNTGAVGFMTAAECLESPDVSVIVEIPRSDYRSMIFQAAPVGTGEKATYVVDFLRFCYRDDEAKRVEQMYGLSDTGD
jgi:hypothetical protein